MSDEKWQDHNRILIEVIKKHQSKFLITNNIESDFPATPEIQEWLSSEIVVSFKEGFPIRKFALVDNRHDLIKS